MVLIVTFVYNYWTVSELSLRYVQRGIYHLNSVSGL